MNTEKAQCPCCGYLTLPAPQKDAVAFICPVCFWENDVSLQNDDEPSDENGGMALREARKNYSLFGACAQTARRFVRKPTAAELSGAEGACPPLSDCCAPAVSHRPEDLLACTILMQASLCTAEAYIALVDAMFLENSESALLQELEWSTRDIPHGIHLIEAHFEQTPANDAALKEILLERLRAVYLSGSLTIKEFARRAYRLWSHLPEALANEDSFSILSCADEVLDGWYQKDPEKEARALYEKALGLCTDDGIREEISCQDQGTSGKSGPRRCQMKKRKTDIKPITRMSLYWLSTWEVFAVFGAIGGMAFILLLIFSLVRILQGEMAASGLGGVALGGLVITGLLLLIGYGLTQGRTRPPYRYYKKHNVRFPSCLKGKCLTCTDHEHYLYFDDTWFVAVLTMGASALCADVIDFSVPVTESILTGRGNIAYRYQFRAKDGAVIPVRLGRRIKPFKKWVQAHGGTFA